MSKDSPQRAQSFTLAPAAKAEIWYASNGVKLNPAGHAQTATTRVADLISCVEIWSKPTPLGPVTVPGPIQKCDN
jgi:hypothetical protein